MTRGTPASAAGAVVVNRTPDRQQAAAIARLQAAGRSAAPPESAHALAPLAHRPGRPAPSATPAGAPVRPHLCCVYCGHLLYAPPKATRVRCPVCTRELSVLDVVLRGDVQKADEIVTAGAVVVPLGARVAADLVACNVDIGGKVLGDVLASHACRVRCTAKVSGRILCRHLVLEPGAEVQGLIEIIDK
jgi:hypothetical protein